jgi:hypothetical protein
VAWDNGTGLHVRLHVPGITEPQFFVLRVGSFFTLCGRTGSRNLLVKTCKLYFPSSVGCLLPVLLQTTSLYANTFLSYVS